MACCRRRGRARWRIRDAERRKLGRRRLDAQPCAGEVRQGQVRGAQGSRHIDCAAGDVGHPGLYSAWPSRKTHASPRSGKSRPGAGYAYDR